MNRLIGIAALIVVLCSLPKPCRSQQIELEQKTRQYLLRLQADPADPSVNLPVRLEFYKRPDGETHVSILNGPERIEAGRLARFQNDLVIDFPHYDSTIRLDSGWDPWSGEPSTGQGSWQKRRGPDNEATVSVTIQPWEPISWTDPKDICGRWSVKFADSDDRAVAVFSQAADKHEVFGTFLTTTGDYRYLAGGVRSGHFTLSCFDGAHAFLFQARLNDNGSLEGQFRNGNWYQTGWTAQRDEQAALPDAFQQTHWTDRAALADLKFPNVQGEMVALDDERLSGKCRIIEVFGTWCPNCHDAAAYLAELHEKYGDQGLAITGLAFEMTGDFQRDARQVQRFAEKTGTRWPVLIAGTADKTLASEQLPILDRIRSYPTMIFLDRTGQVVAIYTGFSGPATGEAHQKLRQQFEAIIQKCLDE